MMKNALKGQDFQGLLFLVFQDNEQNDKFFHAIVIVWGECYLSSANSQIPW